MGSSPITSVIERGSGIQEGGRTGITAIVVSFLFFISLFLSPIFASIPPWATGPALIVIGAMMFKTVLKINWDDFSEAVPSFITIIIMPFTFSIAYGIIAGLMVHCVMAFFEIVFNRLFPPKINSLKDEVGSSNIPLMSTKSQEAY